MGHGLALSPDRVKKRTNSLDPDTSANPYLLLAVKLNDKLLVDISVDILTCRQRCDRNRKISALRRDPCRTSSSRGGRPRSIDVGILRALFLDRHDIADLDLERRDVHLASVNKDVAMVHDLPSLATRSRKTRTIHDVVQTTFKHEQKVLARNALLTKCLFEIVSELFFEDEV